jgi:hypothetical protein
MMALHGVQNLWHPMEGMICSKRTINVRCYPHGRHYSSQEDFATSFSTVVGHFGRTGTDVEEICNNGWMGPNGTKK